MMLRPSRLLAVAHYEMRSHMAGRQGLRFAALAAVLLLPVGMLRLPFSAVSRPYEAAPPPSVRAADSADALAPRLPTVRGILPPALAGKVMLDAGSEVEIVSESPLRLRAETVPADLREVLETLPEPASVEVRRYRPPVRLPGRSLLIAILAVSLLTGPLAEALPGERARRTLEVLLSAGVSRAELIGGKWLAWTLSATLTAWLAAAGSCLNSVQTPGWWLLGLPLFIASSVAFGLWLVRLVDDVVGGAAAPMRVLPVVAGLLGLLARSLQPVSPVLAAMVPLGGPLLLAADILTTPASVLAGALGSAVFVSAALALTGRDLDRFEIVAGIQRHGAIGLGAVALLLWWLAVAGPAVWTLAGNAKAVSPLSSSLLAGGLALLGCASIACAREGVWPWPVVSRSAVLGGLLVGVLLASGGPFALRFGTPPTWALDLSARLVGGATPSLDAPGAALACLVGQAWLFRFVVARRAGWLVGALLWTLAIAPFDPLAAAPAALALGLLASGMGVQSALIAHGVWIALAALAPAPIATVPAFALQTLAVAAALTVVMSKAGAPSRQ